jgi:nucleoside-diphosphate-sugar epimerase
LGRAVVSEARAAGARVTVFNRGRSGPTPEGAEHVTGDRTRAQDLAQLNGRHFDVVVDTSGYVPADVALSAKVLAPNVDHYAFVSTVNVFPGWPEAPDYRAAGLHDGGSDATHDDAPDDDTSYGWLKSGCERAVVREFGADRSSLLRAGLIVGPDDSQVGRLPWWIARIARGGEVLTPGAPDDAISMIDSRDLASFALAATPGAFEVCGARSTRGELMRTIVEVTGSDARLTWIDHDWLAGQGVEPWTEVPLWIPPAEAPSLFDHETAPARAAGLQWRPMRDIVADTWTWQQRLAGRWQPSERTPGLEPAKEAALLAAWHDR